jgi:hypothetical protein
VTIPRTMTVLCHTTALPVESNNITLDPQVKMPGESPYIRVTYKCRPDDLKTMTSSASGHWNCWMRQAHRKWASEAGDPEAESI